MLWRCREVKPAMWFAAVSRQASSLPEIGRLFETTPDAGEQLAAADQLLEKGRGTGLRGLNGHRHVAITGDHGGQQSMARITERLPNRPVNSE